MDDRARSDAARRKKTGAQAIKKLAKLSFAPEYDRRDVAVAKMRA
jgi:hypothetical protein